MSVYYSYQRMNQTARFGSKCSPSSQVLCMLITLRADVQFAHTKPVVGLGLGLPSDVMTTCVHAHVGLGIFIQSWFLDEDPSETPSPECAAPSVPTPSPVVAARLAFGGASPRGLGMDLSGMDVPEMLMSYRG